MHDRMEAVKNYLIGLLGISISVADITTFAQAIGAVCGAVLVAIQLYRTVRKK